MDDQQLYEANYHLHVEGLVEELYGELLRMFDHMVDGDDMVEDMDDMKNTLRKFGTGVEIDEDWPN